MRNSNKLLALALAAVLALGSTATAFAADTDKADEGTAVPISDTTQPADENADPTKGEDAGSVGDEDKKDEDADPAEGEDKKDEDAAPAEGEDKKDEDAAPAEGEDKKDETPAASMPYTDFTEQNWYYGAVAFVTENKLMDGLTETTFGPSENMTRQMLAVALYRLAGSPEVTAENPFTDVAADAAYKDAVVWAYSVGVVNGVTDTTFSPDSSIQRQAIAAMLARYLKVDTSADTDVSAFADADQIQTYAIGSMAWASANKLLQGDTNSNVDPRGNATRAQVATILQRFAEMAEGKAPTADTTTPADDTKPAGDTTPADDTKPAGDTTPADGTEPAGDTTTPADDTEPAGATTPADDTEPAGATTAADDKE